MTETQAEYVTEGRENQELAVANRRLNERVRELEFNLGQCEDDRSLAFTERDEARQWARALLARAENLGWLVERIGASWNEDTVELDKAHQRIAEMEQTRIPITFKNLHRTSDGAVDFDEDDLPHYCSDCGTPLQHVRPGKWQCNRCG